MRSRAVPPAPSTIANTAPIRDRARERVPRRVEHFQGELTALEQRVLLHADGLNSFGAIAQRLGVSEAEVVAVALSLSGIGALVLTVPAPPRPSAPAKPPRPSAPAKPPPLPRRPPSGTRPKVEAPRLDEREAELLGEIEAREKRAWLDDRLEFVEVTEDDLFPSSADEPAHVHDQEAARVVAREVEVIDLGWEPSTAPVVITYAASVGPVDAPISPATATEARDELEIETEIEIDVDLSELERDPSSRR